VVIDEAVAMEAMGAEVTIHNLPANRAAFERAYPDMPLPTRYVAPEALPEMAADYDAVVATFNTSVEWLAPLGDLPNPPVRGYYVQGYEPLIYPEHTPDYERALRSYALFDDLVRITKTEWTRRQVLAHTGVDSRVVGPSVNIDLFRPRPRDDGSTADAPLRIAAMVRALRDQVVLCEAWGNARPEEGGEHFLAYCLEDITRDHYIHGNLIALNVLAVLRLQRERAVFSVEEMKNFFDAAGLAYRPAQQGIARRDYEQALLTAPDFVRRENLFKGLWWRERVFDHTGPLSAQGVADWLYGLE
jgi:hypothetical protein